MRQTIRKIETNMAYRWFLGFGFHSEVPYFSTSVKIMNMVSKIPKEIADKGLLSADQVFIDSAHVKASANKRKFEQKIVRKETRAYEAKLQEELNQDRGDHGKKPFPPDTFEKEEGRRCLFLLP